MLHNVVTDIWNAPASAWGDVAISLVGIVLIYGGAASLLGIRDYLRRRVARRS